MTDMEIRIKAATYLHEHMGGTTPESIAQYVGVTVQELVNALDVLCKSKSTKNLTPHPQSRNFLYITPDGNSKVPACYNDHERTEEFLRKPF